MDVLSYLKTTDEEDKLKSLTAVSAGTQSFPPLLVTFQGLHRPLSSTRISYLSMY